MTDFLVPAGHKGLLELCGWPIVPVVLTIGIAALFFVGNGRLLLKRSATNRNRRFIQFALSAIMLVWAIGWGLYMIAISCNEGAQTGALEKIFRSATASIGMFAFSLDSTILDNAGRCMELKGALSVVSFIAGGCTFLLLINTILRRFKASIWLSLVSIWSRVAGARPTVYLFWGVNQQSRLLADSIRSRHNRNDYRIVIVDLPLAGEEKGPYNLADKLIKIFANNSQTLSEAEKKNTVLSVASVDIADLPPEAAADIFRTANLNSIKRELRAEVVHMFFLSENEDSNIARIRNMANDRKTIPSIKKLIIHCRARRNDLYRSIEDLAITNNLEVRITDPSNLSVEMLKRDPANHPVQLMDVDTKQRPTTVTGEFNSLVVGFDATGRDAFRFLYEYGAFVDSSSVPENVRRSIFHCTIVDKEIELRAAPFKIGAPAVAAATNFDGTPMVDFSGCDYNSEGFYSGVLAPVLEKLNVIFITVGNDEEGMALAVRIFRYARRYRADLTKLRIYVRCYSSGKAELMNHIANHYREAADKIIIPFGDDKEVFTYDNIVDATFMKDSQAYYANYARMKGSDETWDMRRNKVVRKMQSRTDAHGRGVGINLDELASLRRTEYQDMANALHAATKIHLLRKVMPADFDWDAFFERYFDGNGKPKRTGTGSEIRYEALTDDENKTVHALAMLEHLRWNASHELLGYVCQTEDGPHKCDERTMRHNCLRNWQELNAESAATGRDYKSSDFIVVDTTISIYYKKAKKQ